MITPAVDCDVAIVGLGPVGAALANLLAERGLTVIALERELDVMEIPRAVGIDGEIMRVMQAIGVTDELEPLLKVFRGTQYLDVDGNVVATRPGVAPRGPQGWANRYNVHQPDLEHVLRDALIARPGVELRLGVEVTDIAQDEHSATVTASDLRTGEPLAVTARFVVGADGGRSVTRRVMGTTFDDYGLNEPWVVADFAVNESANLPDVNTHFADPVHPVIYVNVVRNIRRFEFKATPDEDPETLLDPDLVWQRVSKWMSRDDAELLRVALYTHRSIVAQKWWDRRLLLVGDAAHQTPPFLGQGLCAGLRDAAALAWRLGAIITDGAPSELLASYESERGEHARFYIRTAAAIGPVLQSPDRATLESLNARVGREGSGETPRLGEGLFSDRELGGTLAPQPALADGTMLDDIAGYEFVVLLTAEVDAALDSTLKRGLATARLKFVVATGPARDWLRELGKEAVVIRPDRYFFGAYEGADELAGALETLVTSISGQVVRAAHA